MRRLRLDPRRAAASVALIALMTLAGCAGVPQAPVTDAALAPAAPLERPPTPPAPLIPSAPDVAQAAGVATDAPAPYPAPAVQISVAPADVARQDLWARVRKAYRVPEIDGDLVRKWELWYANRPDYVQRMTARGGRYLFHIVEEIERRQMPVDLALLPFIESAFNPQAMSSARASGMWQFMPATGKDFELRQNLFRDDRRDVLASTRAALDYLQRLRTLFGDWHLALAAYNWGQGNVLKAIERNRRAGLDTGYEALRMPDETRNYVPKLQAVKNIVARPQHFDIQLPPLENHPFFISVPIERDIDVALAAKLAGMPLEDFQQLNPQMNKPVILAAGTPQVLLPYDQALHFQQQLALHQGPMASWTAWVAPKTVKPADAARMVGISEAQLREVNHIPPRMMVKAGSTLLVPRKAHSLHDVSERLAESASMALTPEARPLRRVTLKAGKQGESVASVARRHKVSASQVALWNKLAASASFQPGQTIVLMLPAQAATRPSAAARR